MPISARWRKLETLPAPRGRDAMPGVYELADEAKRVIYIGQSLTDVPNRIRQHLQGRACVAARVCFWRYGYSRLPQASEADLIAAHLARHGELPLCNRASPRVRDALRRYLERSRGGG
ncbi:hypothetical protein BH24DEI1_BH24DEI1_11590 [soil metagenome]